VTKIIAGATLERNPGKKYTEKLSFAELKLSGPTPRPNTMAKWRSSLPDEFRIAWVLPKNVMDGGEGFLRINDTLKERLEQVRTCCDALQPFVLVITTSPEITPGQRDRDRLASYFEYLHQISNAKLVWSPRGMWENESAVSFGKKHQVSASFDPLEDALPSTELVYARLRAMGVRQSFTEDRLYFIMTKLLESRTEETFVAIESAKSFREASQLEKLIREDL
jgi:uncharacterized protein YecE (DUF72 family)